YESGRGLDEFSVVCVSVAYELEIAGLVRMLDAAGIPARRDERASGGGSYPLIIVGGPLTFSNPLPLAAIADAIVVGEAELVAVEALRVVSEAGSDRARQLDALARLDHVLVPEVHGARDVPEVAKVPDELLPAWAPIRTPHAVLSDMFLIEAERGCSRRCTYC